MPPVAISVDVDAAVPDDIAAALRATLGAAATGAGAPPGAAGGGGQRRPPPPPPPVVVRCSARLPLERSVALSVAEGPRGAGEGAGPFLTVLLLPLEAAAQLRRRGRLVPYLRACCAALRPPKRPRPSSYSSSLLSSPPPGGGGGLSVLLLHPRGARGVGATRGDCELSAAAAVAGPAAIVGVAHCGAGPADVAAHIAAAARYAQRGGLRRGGAVGTAAAAGGDVAALTEPQGRAKAAALDWAAAYRAMLAEVPGVSERRARCVAAVFPTLDALLVAVAARDRGGPRRGCPFDALAQLPEGGGGGAEGGGGGGDRRFGAALVDRVVEAVTAPLDMSAL